MSYFQVLGPDNKANYKIYFDETINLKPTSKIALVDFSGYKIFNVNLINYLDEFSDEELKFDFIIGDEDNSYRIEMTIDQNSIENYGFNPEKVNLDEFITIVEKTIREKFETNFSIGQIDDINERVEKYQISIFQEVFSDGRIGVLFEMVSNDYDEMKKNREDPFFPKWDESASTITNNFDLTDKTKPVSDANTSANTPAICSIDYLNGVGINNNFLRFFITDTTTSFNFGLSMKGLNFGGNYTYFRENNPQDKNIYCPIVFYFDGNDTGDGQTLKIYKHDNGKDWTTDYTEQSLIATDKNITKDTEIVLYIFSNETIKVEIKEQDSPSRIYYIEDLDDDYLFPDSLKQSRSITAFFHTTEPNKTPVYSFLYSNSINFDNNNVRQYFKWNSENTMFFPLTFVPNNIAQLIGFLPDDKMKLITQQDGFINLISQQIISTDPFGIDRLNIHITNLQIKSYKNNGESLRGGKMNLLSSVDISGLGKFYHEVKNLMYVNLNNFNERINFLNIEIRDARNNKLTDSLDKETILTFHLIE